MKTRLLAFLLTCVPAALAAQAAAVSGVVVANATGESLPYAIVSLEGANRSAFANDSGHFAFHDVPPGKYVLRVKRLGYSPAALTIQLQAGVGDTVRIRLNRVTVRLENILVSAYAACKAPGIPAAMDTAVKTIVAQLQLNAEQVRFMAEEYPFEYYLQVLKVRVLNDGRLFSDDPVTKRYTSKTRSSYRPGEVLRREGGANVFHIPEIQDVASPQFLSSHCWHYAGTDTIDGALHYRIDVVAAEDIRGVDINGSFYINAESFQIRRSVLRLSQRAAEVPAVIEMETTTHYQEILPSVPLIANVYIVQKIDPRVRSEYHEVRETQHAHSYLFLNRIPGDSLPLKKP